MLLIITNQQDLACDYLILRLNELNIPYTRLNTENLGKEFYINISLNSRQRQFEICFQNGKTISNREVKAVYFRQPRMPNLESIVEQSDVEFAERETMEFYRALWRLIDEKKWLNHPKHLWLASNKVEQLCVASELGFNIPDSCLSINKDIVSTFFYEMGEEVIGKAVKHGFFSNLNSVTFATTQELENDYINNFNDYAPIPMMYQKKINKEFDIRVTVIKNSVFATAIHSQQHNETKIDWRLWDICDINLHHEATDLPPEVATRCVKITKHFNLNYSAIDLIKDVDGKYIFLELNPNGQWAWIEQITGVPIRDTIIKALVVE